MRLTTFNVLHGRSPADQRVDLDRFAGAVRELEADVLALQEVDRGQERSHTADLTQVAAEATGARDYRFAPALSGSPGAWSAAGAAEPAGTPQYGVALVSRYPVTGWQVVRLPALRPAVPVLFPGRRRPVVVRDEPRVAVVAQVAAPGGALTVACTHLSFIPWWNLVQLRRLARSLAGREPLVLMGDLNLGPAAAARVTGLDPLADGATYPADAPAEQIDHILGRGVRATSPGEVRCLPVSDHCALSVQMDVTG